MALQQVGAATGIGRLRYLRGDRFLRFTAIGPIGVLLPTVKDPTQDLGAI